MHGNLEQVGTPIEVYNAPRNRFVAGFIGSPKMNFLTGGVAGREGDLLRIEVPMENPVGGEMSIGLRSEICHLLAADGGTVPVMRDAV